MIKPLIAVPTCEEFADRRQACLDTWANTHLCDVRFFTAADLNIPASADKCYTDYRKHHIKPHESLSYRTREICRWALSTDYTHVFKCDDDTFVRVPRLLASGFEQFHYSGYVHVHVPLFCSGGAGYWLDRRAIELIAAEENPQESEDVWVGGVLLNSGITAHMDERYRPDLPKKIPADFITLHYVKDPALMHSLQARYA